MDPDKSYPSLLRKYLNDKFDVYSFGKSGAPLSQYLHMSRYVNDYFDPDILILSVVHNDFDESITSLNPSFIKFLTLNISNDLITEKLPQPNYSFQQYNWKKRTLMKSATFRYLFYNLKAKNTILKVVEDVEQFFTDKPTIKNKVYNANVEVNRIISNKDLIEKSTEYILGKIKDENLGKKVIFVIDGLRNDIYNNKIRN